MNKEKGVCSSMVTEKPLVAQKMDWKAFQVIQIFADLEGQAEKWKDMEDFWDSAVAIADLHQSFMDCKEGSMNQKYFKILLDIRIKLDTLYAIYEKDEFRDLGHMKSHKLFKSLKKLANLYVESYRVQKFR